ncbi:hypothetical protein BDZ94DRAFT_1256856 [Collybia nuda]|uniref:Uncharacterized protein n=1 Tax=Collybia nuda TaxID=64659 RepID=A0A9P5Y8X6_9AGAR|nr:hypothetical protein BDZ94DRAFT_1256856 [Collybia nuda]
MDHCCGVEFSPPDKLNALRHLTILGNDNLDMFTTLCCQNPAVTGLLQTLDLQCDPKILNYDIQEWNYDVEMSNYDIEKFKETLAQCTALRSLHLVLGGLDSDCSFLGVICILPNCLEHLTYRGMPEISKDLPQWLKLASDPEWLPQLKTISFGLDVSGGPSLNAEESVAILEQVEEFLDTLSSHRPYLHILDST